MSSLAAVVPIFNGSEIQGGSYIIIFLGTTISHQIGLIVHEAIIPLQKETMSLNT